MKKTTIPAVAGKDPALRRLLTSLKEAIEIGDGVTGDPLDRKVTLRDLIGSGLAIIGNKAKSKRYISSNDIEPKQQGAASSSESPSGDIDLTPPDSPEGLSALQGIGMVFLSWNSPIQDNHAHTNIYRSTENNFSNASVITNTLGRMHADSVPYEVIDTDTSAIRGYFYWITFVSDAGIEGAPNAVSGLYQEPIKDGSNAFKQLSVNMLVGDTANFVRANIDDASITSAKIANIIKSSNYSSSKGWAIYKSGLAVFNNISARGTIAGSRITGSIIDGGVFIGGADITLPTEADTGSSPRYLAYASGNTFSLSGTESGNSYAVFTVPIKAANYSGDGTVDYDGYQAYKNFDRYPVYNAEPRIVIETLPSALNFPSGTTLYIGIDIIVEIGGVQVAALNTNVSFGSVQTTGASRSIPFAAAGFEGTVTCGARWGVGQFWGYYLNEGTIDLRLKDVPYNTNDSMVIKARGHVRGAAPNGYNGYTYGHTAIISDDAGHYL